MKKRYIVLIIIIAVLVCGFFAGKTIYDRVDAKDLPVASINIAGQDVNPISADFTVPVFGGLIEKSLNCMLSDDGTWWVVPEGIIFDMEDPTTFLGELGEAPYPVSIALPDDYSWDVTVTHETDDGESPIYVSGNMNPLTSGSSDRSIVIEKAGSYIVSVTGTLVASEKDAPAGTVYYRAEFSVKNPEPKYTVGTTTLAQGDILSLSLENIPEGITPEIESGLGSAVFAKGTPKGIISDASASGEGEAEDGTTTETAAIALEGFENWYAAVPISNTRTPGDYALTVTAGDLIYETTVTVTEYDFDFQNLIIDTSIPSVAAAISGEAITEFQNVISPLFQQFSEEVYWEGYFEEPVDMGTNGFISTQFGEQRITNGDNSTLRSHNGMDYAVSTGTPVHAGNSGVVLVAQFLLNTGNTVVIDHGGGLKSFYYHMDTVDETLAGTMVQKGALLGTVGSTGYSTGPHLHYEMRIGEQPISPSMLFDPNAGLYSASR